MLASLPIRYLAYPAQLIIEGSLAESAYLSEQLAIGCSIGGSSIRFKFT